MSRYDTMTAAEILRTMGLAQKDLLAELPVRWDDAHPSTRRALIDRGLAYLDSGGLKRTGRGHLVADLVHADVAEDTWETTR